MSYLDLIGRPQEEVDKYPFEKHKKVLEYSKKYKQGKIEWNDFEQLQNSLMESGGYTSKKIVYMNGVSVEFGNAVFPSNKLYGRGKSELEAICNACCEFVKNSYDYNTFSIKYFNELREQNNNS